MPRAESSTSVRLRKPSSSSSSSSKLSLTVVSFGKADSYVSSSFLASSSAYRLASSSAAALALASASITAYAAASASTFNLSFSIFIRSINSACSDIYCVRSPSSSLSVEIFPALSSTSYCLMNSRVPIAQGAAIQTRTTRVRKMHHFLLPLVLELESLLLLCCFCSCVCFY